MSSPQQKNIKKKVFTCLTKLSDRDTHSLAVAELESIARNLNQTTVPSFLSCILSTDSSDKSLVRKQCVNLLGFLAETHGNMLSPHLSKILNAVVRRLRDPDSSVRSACVNSVSALSRYVTKQPFSTFLKPLSEALFTEQDQNSQLGAALCFASAIDGAPAPEPAKLAKLLPRLEKLLKRDAFKAKPAVITLIGSIVEAGGASNHAILKNLVPCLVESLSSSDWAARKAAAEALVVMANVERGFLSEYKAGCLKVFENRRFDKVKVVREVMNQMLEAWKQIPDVSDEFSPPPRSQSSSKGNSSEHYQNSCNPRSLVVNLQKKSTPVSRFSLPDCSSAGNAKNTSALSSNKRVSSGVLRKLNHKNWDVQVSVSNDPSAATADHGDLQETDGTVLERSKKDKSRLLKPEMRRALFNKNPDDKTEKFGEYKAGSRVVPCHEECQNSVPVSDVSKDIIKNEKETEDLYLIRNQLHQIEKQQSSLLDLVQKFIGSSQSGMHSLETRVHGLELVLDEISYDLAISRGSMTNYDEPGNACCLLPGAEFLSSRFWRKAQGRYSFPRFSKSGSTPSLSVADTHYRLRPDGGFIINPLAEVRTNARDFARGELV
ncbi:PREDICTED: microtubule-associated protein TORTIFOLIA1-like isoform X2 [Lupinus angustifolius]|uniref:microtubule-associated protein TORTIFOLIA1-like isoform X2 n=1 Tax=Lupinus angustifolius TaxID=3871 RepID=UPI00092EFB90|nr:PREDICTED: microtubule-associated protein TORTIFOLIA1-like isoform X2 [Lupinus angustifolius]